MDMSECRIHLEDGRLQVMTRRFVRRASDQKLYMQSLAALHHYDFNVAGAFSYEQAVETILILDLLA